jgi:predicted nucleic acid-binding protein
VAIVLDASLLVALVSGDPRADAVSAKLAGWLASGDGLHAPALTPFEVANGLTRLVAAGAMPADRVEAAWHLIQELPVTYHPLRDGPLVVSLARRLERQSAYDAAYLALAQELSGACWTLDGRLVRNAARLGSGCRCGSRRPERSSRPHRLRRWVTACSARSWPGGPQPTVWSRTSTRCRS